MAEPAYRIEFDDRHAIIRVPRDLIGHAEVSRFLEFLELETIRRRSQLTEEDAAALAADIDTRFGIAFATMLEGSMNWREHIDSDPAVLAGKPVVRGTRLSADFILGLFASGWTEMDVLENYPQLSAESIRAVHAFAAESPLAL